MKRLLRHSVARPPRQMMSRSAPINSSRLLASRRFFATGSNGSNDTANHENQGPKLPFNDGWLGRWQYAMRVIDRFDKLEPYEQANVFHPNSSSFARSLLFCFLNLPTNTEIDLFEFLDGAKVASQSVLNKMWSQEFMEFCQYSMNSNLYKSHNQPETRELSAKARQVARDLQRCLSPLVYKRLVKHTQKTIDTHRVYVKTKDVELENAYLLLVKFNRVSRPQYEARRHEELRDAEMVPKNDVFHADRFDDDEFVEVLQLTVRTVCKVELQIEEFVERGTAVCNWCFESVVTDPQDLDWVVSSYTTKLITKKEPVVQPDDATSAATGGIHESTIVESINATTSASTSNPASTSPTSTKGDSSKPPKHDEPEEKLKQAIAQAAQKHHQQQTKQQQQQQHKS